MFQHYKQITPQKILAMDKDTSIIPEIINDDKKYPRLESEQAWNGIHYLLTGDDSLEVDRANPLYWFILGWAAWKDPDVGYGPARFIAPKEVTQLANVLQEVKDEELKNRFDPEKMNELGIYPDGIWDEEGILNWLMDIYHNIKDFLIDAKDRGNGVLIWTD